MLVCERTPIFGLKMYKIFGVLLIACFAYGWASPQEQETKVTPEDLDKLLKEKNYKKFALLLGIEDEKFVRPIEDPATDDRKYNKSLCVTDLVYTYPRWDEKTRLGRYWPKSANGTMIPVAGNADPAAFKQVNIALRSLWPKQYKYVRFQKYGGETDYVYIFKGPSCFADIGRRGGPQAFSVNSECGTLYRPWDIFHLAMHVAGFPHEHNRPERNKFITVQKDNLLEGAERVYRQYVPGTFPVWRFYDYFSITHFLPHEFSKPNKAAYAVRDAPHLKLIDLRLQNKTETSLYDHIKLYHVYGKL